MALPQVDELFVKQLPKIEVRRPNTRRETILTSVAAACSSFADRASWATSSACIGDPGQLNNLSRFGCRILIFSIPCLPLHAL